MIVIGYQGIGKSTLANKNIQNIDLKYIDLESGNFWIDGKRYDDWYIPYCNIAEDLSKQGYLVFVSSHEVVRNQLVKHCSEPCICVVPDFSLKDKWIQKLKRRYEDSKLTKDYKAWRNSEERFIENISEIIDSGIPVVRIKSIDYNLHAIISKVESNL